MTLVREYQPTFVLGDGETKEFPYLFEEVSENFVKVIVKRTDGSTYVPVFSADLDSHKVVFGESEPAPENNAVVCIYRDTPDLQDTPFRTLQGYDAKALENILSKIVAMIQELKANGFSTQVLQGTPWQLDLLHPADDGASVVVDYNARILKKGLYFQLVSGNLQVSADGVTFITIPKSADVLEFRQQETVLEDLTVVKKLQYRVGNQWYDAEYEGSMALDIANQALDATESLDVRVTKNEEDIAAIIEGGNIDGVTIQTNPVTNRWEVQAVANQNTAQNATNPIYDWVGTMAEYTDQNIATLHPEWLCYITNDMYDPGSTYSFEQGVAADTWYVTHNLDKYPSVTVVDSAGTTIDCTITYINSNECELKFNAAFKGTAYLN